MTNGIILPANAQTQSVSRLYESLRRASPATKDDLKNYIKVFLGIDVPDRQICPEHNSPLDYLWHSFNCDFLNSKPANADCVVWANRGGGPSTGSGQINPALHTVSRAANADCVVWANRGGGPSTGSGQINPALHTVSRAANTDCVVWANRGGGKTDLAAVATLLDCVFKPNCQVRILAGSEEQAGRMYRYLTDFLRLGFDKFLAEPIRKTGCRFTNGSAVDCLTQSQASVRVSISRSSAATRSSFSITMFSMPRNLPRKVRTVLSPVWKQSAQCTGHTGLCRKSFRRLQKPARLFSNGASGKQLRNAAIGTVRNVRCGAIARAGRNRQTDI